MAINADIKKTAADTGYAVVGLTDIAVERVRGASARAAAVRSELEVKKVQDRVEQVPTRAVTLGLEAAGKVEETYGELSARGKRLVERIKKQRATQDLLNQGKVAVSRTKAAVTTARRGGEQTGDAAAETVKTAKRDASATARETKKVARRRSQPTKAAAEKTAETARRRASTTKSATKAATTSATKTAEAAVRATEDAAAKVGD